MHLPDGSTVAYAYDGDGLRASRRVDGAAPSRFVWSRGNVPLLISDGEHRFVYGPDSTPLAQYTADGAVEYLHHDALGSVVAITNAQGDRTARKAYEPYGAVAARDGSATSVFGFAGEYTDPLTGLVYLRARDYDPATGQFLSVDPEVDQTRQPYAYAENNPVQKTDPTGRCFLCDFLTEGIGGNVVGFFEGVGNAASFGLTEDLVDVISPGASCQINRNGYYYGGEIFGTVAVAAATGGSGSLAARAGARFRGLADSSLTRAGAATEAAEGGAVAASGTGNSVRVVEETEGIVEYEAQTAAGDVRLMAAKTKAGDTLTLDGLHVEGPGPNSLGPSALRDLAQQRGRKEGGSKVVVRGAKRTTGRNPGRQPRPIEFRIDP